MSNEKFQKGKIYSYTYPQMLIGSHNGKDIYRKPTTIIFKVVKTDLEKVKLRYNGDKNVNQMVPCQPFDALCLHANVMTFKKNKKGKVQHVFETPLKALEGWPLFDNAKPMELDSKIFKKEVKAFLETKSLL